MVALGPAKWAIRAFRAMVFELLNAVPFGRAHLLAVEMSQTI
jgi:hypothetical protein